MLYDYAELIERLRSRHFRVSDEDVMEHWGKIRADCESKDYRGHSHPRDMFESLLCSIEDEYHDRQHEAADALAALTRELEEVRGGLAG